MGALRKKEVKKETTISWLADVADFDIVVTLMSATQYFDCFLNTGFERKKLDC